MADLDGEAGLAKMLRDFYDEAIDSLPGAGATCSSVGRARSI